MKKLKFLDLFKGWEEIKRKILLIFLTLYQDHITKDYAVKWHMIRDNYVKEDHINR